MRNSPASFLVWALMAALIGLLTAVGWPGFVMGAIFGISLWMILFFGSHAAAPGSQASARRGYVPVRMYATAAAIAVPLGYVFFRLGVENGSMWAPAIILVGLLLPATASTRTRSP